MVDEWLTGIKFYLDKFNVTREDLVWFVGMLVDANIFKAVAKENLADHALEVYRLFQSVVYSFTKPKLFSLCEVSEFKALFSFYIETGVYEKCSILDQTLSKNKA